MIINYIANGNYVIHGNTCRIESLYCICFSKLTNNIADVCACSYTNSFMWRIIYDALFVEHIFVLMHLGHMTDSWFFMFICIYICNIG